jgi:ligand-binding sensor domain-containing protein
MRNFLTRFHSGIGTLAAAGLWLALCAGLAGAQGLDFQPLINARSITSLLEVGDKVVGGLDEGGLVLWDRTDPSSGTRLNAGKELSGNLVTDIAWSGRNVWVATMDGGLTRIGDLDGGPEFRQYSGNLGSTSLTAVTGAIIGGSEWVYYAMEGGGIGRIVDGLPGYLYNAEQDGLIDNNVTALQFYRGELFVGTPSGISYFSNNEFTDQNVGLSNVYIRDMCVDASGDLLAAGNGGVFRWNRESRTWTAIGSFGPWVSQIASGPAGTFGLGLFNGNTTRIRQYDGIAWTDVVSPNPRAYAIASGVDFWAGGRFVEEGMNANVGFAWLGRRNAGDDFDTWRLDASLVRNAFGVTFGADGTPWIGSNNGHAVSQLTDEGWSSVYQLASAENDSSGLFAFGANVLAMTTGTDGIVYAGQFTRGVMRIDPVAGRTELMNWNTSGLEGGYILRMLTHPDGPIFFMHDYNDDEKVEVLVDPVHWRNTDNWLLLPTGPGGLGSGLKVYDALVERRDVIWFAVETTGLVRWDINGDFLGPDDPLTWLDTSDDRWDEPFTFASNDPSSESSLALAPDGSIWAGGSGLVRFTYNEFARSEAIVERFSEKDSPFAEGLITGNVNDIAVDSEGTLWVATRAGLNRGITTPDPVTGDGRTTFAAWFDLGNYLSNSAYGTLYSPEAIESMPGGVYQRLAVAPDGKHLVLSSDRGAVLLDPDPVITDPGPGNLSSAYVYPNPFLPGEGEIMLKLGGIDTGFPNSPAEVTIHNVEGQLVYEDTMVQAEQGFWDGQNLATNGKDVTSGMYLVRITLNNETVVLPLAVIR